MTHVLIPIKSLDLAKTRLSAALDPPARSGLVLAMLRDLLGVLKKCRIDEVWVISSDKIVLQLAGDFGVKTICEEKSMGYNAAVNAGLHVIGEGKSVAILPGDIPSASRSDLIKLTSQVAADTGEIHIVPDAAREGTNGLFLSSSTLIAPAFGVNSFSRHKFLATESGSRLNVMPLASLALDIDSERDLQTFIDAGHVGSTSVFLRENGMCQFPLAGKERSVA